MIRNIIFFTILWLSMALGILLLIPYLFLLPFRGPGDRYVAAVTAGWSAMILRIGGIHRDVTGKENIPAKGNFIIVSNHQSAMDIPLMLSVMPYKVSFISKKEVLAVPFFNLWFFALGCLAIDRNKPFSSRRKIKNFLSNRRSNPVLIFPEGTRSRKAEAGKFKTGALLYAFNSGADILAIRIDGSYKVYEEKGRIQPGRIRIEIHPPIKNIEKGKYSFNEFVSALEKKLT